MKMTYMNCLKCKFLLSRQCFPTIIPLPFHRCFSRAQATFASSSEARKRRSELFSQEQKRQYEAVGRIEKIEVEYTGVPEDMKLLMNKNVSTPYHCAQHMSQMLVQRSALAQVDDGTLWDMHRPLESSCRLRLLRFKDADPHHVNKAFWRTCCFLLGAVSQRLFKDSVRVLLHSFPSPSVKSGSFVYDVDIDLDDWKPDESELRVISGEMVKLSLEGCKLERLVVDADLALAMFHDNPHKSAQIPNIASQLSDGNRVVLYRCGDHVDISRGPMVGDTSFVGRCTITAVHRIETEVGRLYRFQGVALPKGILLNHFAYGILEKRAKNLNPAGLPSHYHALDQPVREDAEAVVAQQSS